MGVVKTAMLTTRSQDGFLHSRAMRPAGRMCFNHIQFNDYPEPKNMFSRT